MKLRLRFIKQGEHVAAARTICVDVVSDCTIEDIKHQHSLTAEHGISLNGHDALDEEKSLPELGIVSGDLLYVTSSIDHVVGHGPVAVGICLESNIEPSSQIPASSASVSSLEGLCAANVHTIASDSPSCAKKPHKAGINSAEGDDVTATSGPGASMECDTDAHEEDYEHRAEILQRELESECRPVDGCEINRYLREPHVCSESTDSEIPHRLMWILRGECVQTSAEILCIAVHVMMLECGFSQHNQVDDGAKNDEQSSERPLPHNWNVTPGVYRLGYQYSGLPGTSLVVVAMGTHLIIHGQFLSSLAEDKHFKLDIQASDYVNDTAVLGSDGCVYRHLPLLTRHFKDSVAWPLVKEIRTSLSLPPLTGLLSLPQELQVQILSVFLDVASLLRLAEVCRDFKLLSRDRFIWRLAYVRKFGKRSNMELSQDWFQLFKTSYLKTKELFRHYQKMDRILFMPDWLRRRQPYPLIPAAPNQGILGGDYDRHLGFHVNPAIFPPGRGYFPRNTLPSPNSSFALHMPRPIIDPMMPFAPPLPRPIIDPDAENRLLDLHEGHAMQNNNATNRLRNPLFSTRGTLHLL